MSRDHAVHERNAVLHWRSSSRRAALIAGLLFIVADVAGFAGDALLRSFSGPDYLTQLYAHGDLAAAGVLAKVIGALACAGIAVAMYQVLKRASAGMALGSVVFRMLEAAFYLIGAMSLLALLKLSGQFAVAGVADRASLQAIGDALLSLRTYAASLLGVFAFCVGGFLYNLLFFRARLLPRWLSGFGMIATLALTAACLLSLFSVLCMLTLLIWVYRTGGTRYLVFSAVFAALAQLTKSSAIILFPLAGLILLVKFIADWKNGPSARKTLLRLRRVESNPPH